MICLDNSEWMRNGDFSPSRFQAQADAVNLICGAKTQVRVLGLFSEVFIRRGHEHVPGKELGTLVSRGLYFALVLMGGYPGMCAVESREHGGHSDNGRKECARSRHSDH